MTLLLRRLSFLALVLISVPTFAANDKRHVLVKLAAPLTTSTRAELARDGLALGKPVAGGGYIAVVRPGANFENDPRIASIEPLAAQKKVHHTAKREAARPQLAAELDVVFHEDVTLDEARAAIDEVGGSYDALLPRFLYGHRLIAHVPGNKLSALANDDRVLTIAEATQRRVTPRNLTSAMLSRVNLVQAAPYGLSGQGVTLSLFELGEAYFNHPDFGGRLTTHVSEGANDSHATHVAGTIGGSGAGRAQARGMATAANIHQFRVDESMTGNDVTLSIKDTQLAPLGVVADNNSWGYVLGWDFSVWYDLEEYMGAYSLTYAAPLDRIAIEKNILFVHSAGNDAIPPPLDGNGSHYHGDTASTVWCYSNDLSGNDCPPPCTPGFCEVNRHLANAPWTTIGDMESAKNTMVVGAVDSDKILYSRSSRGPTRDGRVKPDLVARGTSVVSTAPGGGYSVKTGTSMASPVVTGIAGLLTQQWRLTFNGANPSVAQLRTLLIAGTEDRGNAGPDYSYGFGLADAKASVDLILADGGAGTRIRNGALAQGQSYEVDMILGAPQNLRVTLGWADPDIAYLGGSDISDPALVNDLDVRVIDAATNVTYPYVLDKNSPTTPATRAANHVDNTEMIEIANAPAGVYRIVVSATTIADASPQAFVLIANAPVANVPSEVFLTATGSGTPSVALSWNAAATGATYDVWYRGGPGAYVLRTAGLTTTSYVDNSVSANAAYLYKILAHAPGGATTWSNADLATTLTFDATLTAGNPIRFTHVNQLATLANALRGVAALGAIAWTHAPQPGGLVRASQITELRSAIGEARTALALPAATYSRAVGAGNVVLATDFAEIRSALE